MTPASPTLAEVTRRLDEIANRFDRLAATLEDHFVRKDVQEAREAATSIQLKGLEDEQHLIRKDLEAVKADIATNRRLVVTSFLAPIVVGVVVFLILSTLGVHK